MINCGGGIFVAINSIFVALQNGIHSWKRRALIDTQNPSAYHSGLFKQRNSCGNYALFALLSSDNC
jgi:hypothetical protein